MKLVGRTEKINIFDFNIFLQAKVDTGAWRNTIHVDDIVVIDGVLNFKIGDNLFKFEKFKTVQVKSSFGKNQTRYAVKLKFKMGDVEYKSSFSLTDRSQMKYPCLLGRSFLSKYNFIVDVSKENINDRVKKS